MLMPRKVKHRKQHRGRMTGQAKGGTEVTFGEYGIQALEPGWISARQIEAARIAMTRHVRRGGKVWIRVFPDKPVTQKPAETRMGSGKGNPEFWVAVVKPGRILFELSYPDDEIAREAIDRAIQKLPIKARFVVTHLRSRAGGGLTWLSKTAELRNMDTEELENRLNETRQELFNLRFQLVTGQLDNTARDRPRAPPGGAHRDDAARARRSRPPRPPTRSVRDGRRRDRVTPRCHGAGPRRPPRRRRQRRPRTTAQRPQGPRGHRRPRRRWTRRRWSP